MLWGVQGHKKSENKYGIGEGVSLELAGCPGHSKIQGYLGYKSDVS